MMLISIRKPDRHKRPHRANRFSSLPRWDKSSRSYLQSVVNSHCVIRLLNPIILNMCTEIIGGPEKTWTCWINCCPLRVLPLFPWDMERNSEVWSCKSVRNKFIMQSAPCLENSSVGLTVRVRVEGYLRKLVRSVLHESQAWEGERKHWLSYLTSHPEPTE